MTKMKYGPRFRPTIASSVPSYSEFMARQMQKDLFRLPKPGTKEAAFAAGKAQAANRVTREKKREASGYKGKTQAYLEAQESLRQHLVTARKHIADGLAHVNGVPMGNRGCTSFSRFELMEILRRIDMLQPNIQIPIVWDGKDEEI